MAFAQELVNTFLEALSVERGFSENSLRAYKTDLSKFFLFMLPRDALEATDADIRCYLKTLQTLSLASIARKLSAIRQFFNFLYLEKIVEKNPAHGLCVRRTKRKLPKVLTEKDVSFFLDRLKKTNRPLDIRFVAIVEVLYASGLRISELVSLPLRALTFEKGTLNSFLYIKGKGGKERVVPINETAKEALCAYLKVRESFSHEKNVWLFPSRSAQGFLTRQGFAKFLRQRAREEGFEPHTIFPHIFRHSCATHLLNNGANLLVVQKILGHEDLSTTEIYTHVDDKKIKELVQTYHPLSHALRKK